MLALLVVGELPGKDNAPQPGSSVEILHARDADEAVEKLGRNRRIDGVLILDPERAPEIVAAIRGDVLAPPPIFLPAGAPALAGTRPLPSREPARLIELAAAALEG